MSELGTLGSLKSKMKDMFNFISFTNVSVKENEVPTEKNSSCASIFATKASYVSN